MAFPPIPDLNEPLRSWHARVFLSSTFRDMDEERTQLVAHTFPKLRVIARERGVELTEVDLRWGITEKEAHTGKTLRICLNEIDECRKRSGTLPFFIGLVGARYGWVPSLNDVDEETLDKIPEVRDYMEKGLSVTEMEFMHGVLADMRHEQSWFFLRHPEFTEKLRSEHPEIKYTDDADNTLDPSQALTAKLKLVELCERLRKDRQNRHAPQIYSSVIELEQRVIDAFRAFLDSNYPILDRPTSEHDVALFDKTSTRIFKQRLDHVEFAHTRLDLHIGGENLIRNIELLVTHHRRILICSEAGNGKTALMANYIKHIQKNHPDINMIYHFCGGARDSSNLDEMLSRLILEIQAFSGIDFDIPKDSAELPGAFRGVLARIPREKQVILLLDALDQLDSIEGMRWWPGELSENVSLIASTRTASDSDSVEDKVRLSQIMDFTISAGAETFTLKGLYVEDRKVMIRELLKGISKNVEEDLLEEIAMYKEAQTPLVLRLLVGEMRLHGLHESLPQMVRNYISKVSPDDFFAEVLSRIDSQIPGATEVFSLIGASVHGLTETDILELTNPGDPHHRRFTNLDWASLHEHLRPHLREQGGCLQWFHDLVRRGVHRKFLADPGILAANQYRLANYFLDPKRRLTHHALREWPELLARLGEKDRLVHELKQLDVSELLAKSNPAQLRKWWITTGLSAKQIENEYIECMVEFVVNEEPSALEEFLEVWNGSYSLTRRLRNERFNLLEKRVGLGDLRTIEALQKLANSEMNEGITEDIEHQKKAVTAFENVLGLAVAKTLSSKLFLAKLHSNREQFKDSLHLRKEVVEGRKTLFGVDHPETLSAMTHLGISHYEMGAHLEAIDILEEVIAKGKSLWAFDHIEIIRAKWYLASSYSFFGKQQQVSTIRKEILFAAQNKYGPDHIQTNNAKYNLSVALEEQGEHDEVLALREDILRASMGIRGEDSEYPVSRIHIKAEYHFAKKEYRVALAEWKECREELVKLRGKKAEEISDFLEQCAACHHHLGEFSDAISLLHQLIQMTSPASSLSIRLKSLLADALLGNDSLDDALAIRMDLLKAIEVLLGDNAPDIEFERCKVADILLKKGEGIRAMDLARIAYESLSGKFGNDCLAIIPAMETMVLCLQASGAEAEVASLRHLKYSILMRELGKDHERTMEASGG
jgi:tetratricopeptide (TPR) repeat protein